MNKQNSIVIFSIFVIFCLFLILPLPWNEPINNAIIDFQFKLRGERPLSDKILVVYIGDEDIDALGVWPISRDYIAYFVHAVNSLEAKLIAIDMLFATPNQRHPEYDQALSNFIETAANVCLPMIYSEVTETHPDDKNTGLYTGIKPTYSIDIFSKFSAGSGYSNLTETRVVRKLPLIIQYKDTTVSAFGFESARLYLDQYPNISFLENKIVLYDSLNGRYKITTDKHSGMRLNHFGNLENIQSMSLIELLKSFEADPKSLDVKDKLVFLIVTASGISNVVSTPLNEIFPASLIHVTTAENILSQNFIKDIGTPYQVSAIGIMILLAILYWRIKPKFYLKIVIVLIPFFLWILSQILFVKFNYVLLVFYPSMAYLAVVSYFLTQGILNRKKEEQTLHKLLEEQIKNKEGQLKKTKQELDQLYEQLKEETALSVKYILDVEKQKDDIQQLEKEIEDLKSYVMTDSESTVLNFSEIIYSNQSPMNEVMELVAKVSSENIPVLIVGETGTGKELIARAIHQGSSRAKSAFIAVNCGALSETLLESELFGHEKGSFTGANTKRRGRFELADGGTIFLDEISETSPAFQLRLLRVLQEGTFEPVGSEETLRVDVRIIAATNKDIQQEVNEDRFRSDLFYRLNALIIPLPPLRDRTEDLPILVRHFLKKYEYESVSEVSDRAMMVLKSYHWPGNIRELENAVRRSAILAKSAGRKMIQVEDFPKEISEANLNDKINEIHIPLEDQILEILRTLKFSRSSISQAARALGNKDRGTITEYFRGKCFEEYVRSGFDLQKAAEEIANSADLEIIENVKNKIDEYTENLRNLVNTNLTTKNNEMKTASAYKGLPKKYHSALDQIIEHFNK